MVVESPSLKCSTCAALFEFGEDERRFQILRGVAGRPQRCPRCRGAELDKTVPGYSFPFLCAGCNVASRVRFQARGAAAMYCQKCLEVQLRAVTFDALPDSRWFKAGTMASNGRRVERVAQT